jgi:anti-anti-sigma factor
VTLGEGNLSAMAEVFSKRHEHSSLSISRSSTPPSLVVAFSGPLDSESSAGASEFLRAAKQESAREGGLCVDLSGVTYVSSTGIGALATAMLEYERIHIPFRLRSVPTKIQAIFELLGLWHFFTVVDEKPAGTL